uniref:hypothetical protein n=1 Tax=Sphingomonas sp. TaxID=28214 RepID=UPI0035BC8748
PWPPRHTTFSCSPGRLRRPDTRRILRWPASPAIRHAGFAQTFFNGLGRFSSRDVAIQASLDWMKQSDAMAQEALTPEDKAAIERGLADVAAGRTYTLDEVFDELERRCLDGR